MFIWKFHVVTFFINAIYMSLAFIARTLTSDFRNTTDLILHIVFAVAYNAFLLSGLSTVVFLSEVGEYVNQVIQTDKSFSGKFVSAWYVQACRW